MASVNREFGRTLARGLNQSCASAMIKSSLIRIKFGLAQVGHLNWANWF